MKKADKSLYYKEEFIKRYKYLYENSEYILAPFMYEESLDDIEARIERYKKLDIEVINDKPFIYLKVDAKTLFLLEDFLLGNDKMEDSCFYKKIEYFKNSIQHDADVEYGKILLEEKNRGLLDLIKLKLDLWTLLKEVRDYILDQSGDLKNKRLKLEALDEYFRVNRYSNDGKIWTSGFELTVHDVCNYDNFSMVMTNHEFIPSRSIDDIGVFNNDFINFFANTSLFENRNNAFHFSEEEKQNIYLSVCDELPWNLKGFCVGDKKEPFTSLEMGYPVLNNVSSCGSEFVVKEDEIFVDEHSDKDLDEEDFYQLCPECGYLVKVTDYINNDVVKKRIMDKCKSHVKKLGK